MIKSENTKVEIIPGKKWIMPIAYWTSLTLDGIIEKVKIQYIYLN